MKMPSIKDLLDAFAASWRVALVALLASSGLLAAEYHKLEYVADTSRWVINAAFIVGIVSGAILLSFMVAQFARLASYPFRIRATNKEERAKAEALLKHAEKLHDLPDDQKYILAYFFTTKQRAFTAEINHKKLIPLVTLGYIRAVSGRHSMIDWPYYIPEHVWDELERYAEGYTIPEEDLGYPLRNPYFN